jgi:hypothetical protein
MAMLSRAPRGGGEVTREFARRRLPPGVPAHHAVTLDRLQRAGVIYATPTVHGPELFRVARRRRRELAFQRSLDRAAARSTRKAIKREVNSGRG